MINLNTIVAITKKELLAHIDNPASHIALIVFVFFWQFLFFRSSLLVGEASLRMLFDYLPWLLLFFAAAVTMTAFSQEKTEGTLELLLTHPVKEYEVILGKFFSCLLLVVFGLFFAIPVAVTFSLFAPFDWGTFLGQFLASILLAASFVSLGLFFSFLLGNPIASLLGSSVVSFFFLMLGSELVTAIMPLSVIALLERLSVSTHVSSMARGVVDVRDVWYFLAFISTFLSLTYLELLKRKYGNRKDRYRRYQLGVYLLIGIAILTSIVGNRIPGRIDLTADQSYTISRASKKTVSELTDIVTITLYASSKLPSQLTPVVREIRDLLREYAQLGNGRISVITKDPSHNPTVAQEAARMGVREVQFNVVAAEEFQVKTGFVGLTVAYGDTHETIPLIQTTGDLEYQITSFIHKLTKKEKKQIAFLSGHGEKTPQSDYQALHQELSKQFEITPLATDSSVLVIAGPTQQIDSNDRDIITKFLKSGKSLLFLLDGYTVSPQAASVAPNLYSFADFLKEYGITIQQDMVYDLRSNETVRLGQGGVGFVLPYPFWLRTFTDSKHVVTSRINSVLLPWTSSVVVDSDVVNKNGYSVSHILKTSPFSGVQSGSISIMPDQLSFPQENLKELIVGIALEPKQSGTGGRIIAVGDSDFLTDQIVQNAPQNIAFGVSALSWLTNDESLTGIRIREDQAKKLLFRNPTDPFLVKYGNFALVFFVPLSILGIRLLRRRNLRNRSYQA